MKAHGLYSVMGNFGGGKTFGTFLDLYGMNKDENYIIANVPYSKVDLFFSTKDQLFKIIDDLEKYCQDTNYNIANYFNDLQNLKNIVLVVDEAHLYFPARGRKDKNNLRDKISIIVSQCRKRRIKIFIISQRLKTVDLNFRRLSDFIIQYKKRSFL
ncbi:MAG: AAA family ATPase [Candidatus Peribacteria bacterium]|jgi:hypothetical protein|nr:AAA family ATPase [Candidatus Peribacteria bacterium]